MNAAGKIAAFTVALAATFGGAYAAGGVLDPISAEPEKVHEQHEAPSPEKGQKGQKDGGAEKGGAGGMDHGDTDHGDTDHGDMDHGDMDHG